jgi:hypothetical protein
MRRVWGSKLTLALVLLAAESQALAQQGPNFNRVNTLRREVTVSPARAGQAAGSLTATSTRGAFAADPLRPYSRGTPAAAAASSSTSSWGQEPRRAAQPMSVQTRTTPHTFYPGMRTAQGPNRNVAPLGRCTKGRAAFLAPGMMSPGAGMMSPGAGMMSPGAGMMGSIPASGRGRR